MSERGNRKPDKERGHTESTKPSRGRLSLDTFSSAKKRRGAKASNQSEVSKRVCNDSTFQDGRPSDVERHPETGRLDGQNRPERCLLLSPDTQQGPPLPQISLGEPDISVQLPTFWSVMRSLGLYQDNQASSNSLEEPGHTTDNLHRRHTSDGRDGVSTERAHHRHNIFTRKSGFCNKPRKINTDATPGYRIPRVHAELTPNGTETPRGENKEHQIRHQENPGVSYGHSSGSVQTSGEDECHYTGNTNSPFILQALTECSERDLGKVPTELQCHSKYDHGSEERTPVVAGSLYQLEWAEPHNQGNPISLGNRCIPDRMGSHLWGCEDRRSLVHGGTEPPHKLPGTPGSNTSSQMLCQEEAKHQDTADDGQYLSSSVYKQAGRDCVPRTKPPHKATVALVHGKGHLPPSTAPPRDPEHNSRHGISGHGRQVRLDAEPKSLPEDSLAMEPTRCGSVCVQADNTTDKLYQLETRPGGTSPRCIHTRLVQVEEVLCQPSLEPDRQSASTDATSESTSGAGSTGMEISSVVSHTTGYADTDPSADSPVGGSYTTSTPGSNAGDRTSASRVGYLRERYKECKLSPGATELLIASWRQKSSKSYDSLFRKWLCWCSERNTDPVSGPIDEVVNFLAKLYEEGYQYRSLNAYRSAISSVHEKVDGYEVGQHPLVSRLLKGAFNQRPPQPRYTHTWNVEQVTTYIESLGDNEGLSTAVLTMKTVMLMSLVRPARSADLAGLDLRYRRFTPEGVIFTPSSLPKQAKPQKSLAEFFYPAFLEKDQLCPVKTLRAYENRTSGFRNGNYRLFLATLKPHKPVAPSTIARWLKTFLGNAGIDTEIFKAHSTRSASTSAAASAGITTDDILKAADWSSETVFQKFYYKPVRDPTFAKAVLSSAKGKEKLQTSR